MDQGHSPPGPATARDLPTPPTSGQPHQGDGMWALVREAVAGSHRDFTRESLGRAILLLAVPMVLEMIMESVFAVVDIFWVSSWARTPSPRWG